MTRERELVVALGVEAVEMLDRLHGKDLVTRSNAAARKYGIDGGYIQHILDKDSENWPSLPGRQAEALKALVGVSDASYAFEYEGKYRLPEVSDEPKVDEILKLLGRWSWDHRRVILQNYLKVLKGHAASARTHLEATTNKRWSDRDAMLWLHSSLKHHIDQQPAGIWRSIMLYRVLDLIF